jgi:hypothetical protein
MYKPTKDQKYLKFASLFIKNALKWRLAAKGRVIFYKFLRTITNPEASEMLRSPDNKERM